MGKTFTPQYRVEALERAPSGAILKCLWSWDHDHISVAALENHMEQMNKSFQSEGANWRVSLGLNYVPYYFRASIINQKTKQEVVQWRAAAFQVV